MIEHLRNNLDIENIDWDDLHLGSLDTRFGRVSWKNEDQQIEQSMARGSHE